jgi:hypothetical protein
MKVVNYSPIAFYLDRGLQPFRAEYAQSCFGYPIVSPKLTTFTFLVTGLNNQAKLSLASAYIYDRYDKQVKDITANIREGLSVLELSSTGDTLTAVYRDNDIVMGYLPDGLYYIKLNIKGDERLNIDLYSDLFSVRSEFSGCIKLVGSNSYAISLPEGAIDFTKGGFRFTYIVSSTLARPEYVYEEEVVSRLGYKFTESIVSKKTYKFVFLAVETLLDSLRLFKLFDNRVIYELNADGSPRYEYRPISFNMAPEWLEQGDVAQVSCDFDVDNIAIRLG